MMSAVTETIATTRLELAITAEQKEMFECAAGIEGMTLEEYAVSVLEIHSENVIRGPQEPLRPLSPRAYAQLADALESPPELSDEVRARYRRYVRRLDE